MINFITAEIAIIILIVIITFHYILFLLRIYFGLDKLNKCSLKTEVKEFVSVIVPFRNEAENIKTVYLSLTEQDYAKEKFEIVFVDDFSDDNSRLILQQINKFDNVRVISVPDDFSPNAHKKRAIRFGIENSKGDIIVTTDADCVHHKNWLKSILSCFDEDTGFVSGPVEFTEESTIFYKMQKIEFAGLVIAGAGLVGAGKPTICNAANIAYRRKVFYEVGGFSHNMNLSSGDDELLMQKIFQDTNYKIKFAISKEAVVKTKANSSIKEFYQQRKRWASKGLFYKNKLLILQLILIYLFYFSLIVQPFLLIFSKIFLFTFIFSFGVKLLLEYLVMKKGIKLFFDEKLLSYFFITEIFQVPYIVIMGLSGTFGNFVWKNRKVKR
jgi:cellulose synthase/poly-beta-1,6-N-acetylglucosamine synthase-like glycosyltransferase